MAGQLVGAWLLLQGLNGGYYYVATTIDGCGSCAFAAGQAPVHGIGTTKPQASTYAFAYCNKRQCFNAYQKRILSRPCNQGLITCADQCVHSVHEEHETVHRVQLQRSAQIHHQAHPEDYTCSWSTCSQHEHACQERPVARPTGSQSIQLLISHAGDHPVAAASPAGSDLWPAAACLRPLHLCC